MRTILFAVLLAACGADRTNEVPPVHQDGVMTYQYVDAAAPKVDVLFVIDSSAAMAPYETQIRQTLQDVATTADATLRGPRANLHLGVLTANLGDTGCTGDGGALRESSLVDGSYMIDRYTPSVDMSNFHSPFADTMMALTDVGTAGCARVQPLEAIKIALAHNDGFVRADAKLAIVVLAAQDDASPGDPADYRAFVQSLKTDPDDAMMAVAAPDASTRLSTFAAGRMAPLTSEGIINFIFNNACVVSSSGEGGPIECLYGDLLDTDASQPGVQPSCTATDDGGSYQQCSDSVATPCWRLTPSSTTCGDELTFTIDRGANDPPTLTNTVTVQCVTR